MVIKNKEKTNVICWLAAMVCLLLAASFLLFAGGKAKSTHANAEEAETYFTAIDKLETWDDGKTLTCFLTDTDYMTADEWSTESTEAYKWKPSITSEDKHLYNVSNAILNKNLDAYNLFDTILIDGVALGEYSFVLMANKYTRVDTLGITFPTAILAEAKEIVIQEGCQLPTLSHTYLGEELSYIEIPETYRFILRNGEWVRKYEFAGYEADTEYDADERNFYLRGYDAQYKGHKEAPTVVFDTTFSENKWGDEGFTMTSIPAKKGDLVVLEFVNPIDAKEFGAINLRVFSNVPRTFVSHNASMITEESLGETLNAFSIPGKTFTQITLISELYANENGMVETIVFRIMDDGGAERDNAFYVGSYSCSYLSINTLVYSDSFFVQETATDYLLIFRFNAKGEFKGDESLDLSKVFINGESVEAINKNGAYAEASWAAVQGIYQINAKISKDYEGVGAIKNAEINYVGNSMQVQKGLALPNGEIVDRSYTCHLYNNENLVDYELIENYEEAKVTKIQVRIEPKSADNLHFMISFDKKITTQQYYHACETEEWRERSLITMANMYDAEISDAYIAGGFKSSLNDNVYINGKSIAEWHATDECPTCVHVHCGQLNYYTLDMSVDSTSAMYAPLYEAFKNGEAITLEVKSGMKFVTGVKTEQDYKMTVKGNQTMLESDVEEMQVFYNGARVQEGDVLVSATHANEANLLVTGVDSYSVEKTRNEDASVSFVITYGEGSTFTFVVQENLSDEWKDIGSADSGDDSTTSTEENSGDESTTSTEESGGGGCGSLASTMGVIATLLTAAAWISFTKRGRRYE